MWFYLGFGLLLAVPGPALEAIRDDFGLGYTGVALAISTSAYGYVAGTLIGGPLSDRVGRRLTLTLASAGMALGVILVGLSPNVGVFVVASVVHGISFGAADPTVTALVGEAAGARAGRALNISQITFGLGSLAAPLIVGAFVGAGIGWRPGYLIAGAVLAISVPIFARLRYPRPRAPALPVRQVVAVMSAPVPALLGLVIALYFGSQLGVSAFWAVHLEQTHALERSLAASSVGVFWAGLLVGRLLGAWLSDRLELVRIATGSISAAAALVLLGALAPTVWLALAAAALAGLAIGPLFPAVLAMGVRHRRGAGGAVVGAMLAIGGVGVLAISPLIGFVVDAFGVRSGLLVVPGLLALALVALLVARRLQISAAVGVRVSTAERSRTLRRSRR
jgi:MFS family permease